MKKLDGNPFEYSILLDDIADKNQLMEDLKNKDINFELLLEELKATQMRLMKEDKMASIGQLSAGIAHEINNPLGFVMSNFGTLRKYVGNFKDTIYEYRKFRDKVSDKDYSDIMLEMDKLNEIEKKNKIDMIIDDLDEIFTETEDGLERVRKIVSAMRIFSHESLGSDKENYDINEGINNTLIITKNETKYTSSVEVDLSPVPRILVNSNEINQVLLNLIVNASHAIKEMQINNKEHKGIIKINTYNDEGYVYCTIQDNGIGISKENMDKIFTAFFTTKPTGKGTGLGLSISYDIIKNKHNGDITIVSVLNEGTKVTIRLPI